MLHFCRGLYKYLVNPGKKVVSEVHYSLTESTGKMRAWYLVFCMLSLVDLGHSCRFSYLCGGLVLLFRGVYSRFSSPFNLPNWTQFLSSLFLPISHPCTSWAFTCDGNLNSWVCVLMPCGCENLPGLGHRTFFLCHFNFNFLTNVPCNFTLVMCVFLASHLCLLPCSSLHLAGAMNSFSWHPVSLPVHAPFAMDLLPALCDPYSNLSCMLTCCPS